MKTKICISLLLCGVLLFGCSPKGTPTRIGKTVTQSSIYFPYYTMEEFIEGVDILAEVEIKEWLGETDYGFESSFYEATVLKEYSNKTEKNFETIKIKQSGNSKSSIENFPLFAIGDRLLVGLKDCNKAIDEYGDGTGNGDKNEKEEIEAFRDYFYIEGCYAGAMQIRQADDKEYVITFTPILQDIEELKIISSDKAYSNLQKVGKELNEELGLDSKAKLQQQGGYKNITERTVIEADKLREYLESLEKK